MINEHKICFCWIWFICGLSFTILTFFFHFFLKFCLFSFHPFIITHNFFFEPLNLLFELLNLFELLKLLISFLQFLSDYKWLLLWTLSVILFGDSPLKCVLYLPVASILFYLPLFFFFFFFWQIFDVYVPVGSFLNFHSSGILPGQLYGVWGGSRLVEKRRRNDHDRPKLLLCFSVLNFFC